MTTDDQLIQSQFDELVNEFNHLHLEKEPSGIWSIKGLLGFVGDYAGQIIEDEYEILMDVAEDYPKSLPKIWETGTRIPKDFHKYGDESLCLGAPLAIKAKFSEDPTLSGLIRNCLIPYLYSFSYYMSYGNLPFGELSHGVQGIYEYYSELFLIKDKNSILKLLRILAGDNYRGHLPCPCGSEKRLRSCHGSIVLKIKGLQPPVDFQNEYKYLLRDK